MFCKNCGKNLTDNSEICMNCGFKRGDGNNFCQHCGANISPGQAMCIKCGFMLIDLEQINTLPEKEPEPIKSPENNSDHTKADYKKYTTNIKKSKTFTLISNIISIVIVLALIFAPIYKYKFVPQSMDDISDIFNNIDSWEELEELLDEDGNLHREFSLFDDFKIILGSFTEKNSDPLMTFIPLMIGLFAIFEIIFAIVLICAFIPQILKTINELKDIDKATMLTFNEIKKSGRSSKKENAFKKQTVITVIIYAIFDVIFTMIYSNIFTGIIPNFDEIVTRHMSSFSGFSSYIYLIIILLISYIVISSMKKNEDNKILESITLEEYENKQ